MKLASLKSQSRDGRLVVVSRDLSRYLEPEILTLQSALENWESAKPALQKLYDELNTSQTGKPFNQNDCHSPLPRAYQWADGSAYLNHVELVRKARNSEVPASFYDDPLMYQGGSDSFIAPTDDIVAKEAWGIDMEAEVVVVTTDLPLGATEEQTAKAIALIGLVNDVSLRNLIPAELAKGFGFLQSKPASAFSPVFVTPDELGDAWSDTKVHLPLNVELNGELFGCPNAGVDMTFNFARLVSHLAKTREIEAGTIVGSGTVSNKQGNLYGSSVAQGGVGYCCIAEVRMYETIENGAPITDFMKQGDTVKIYMNDKEGNSIFGEIFNTVKTDF
ncbi:2-keto-4-pentenoate hydratase [Moraxella bovoculi]|uniref:fumarylacetoacetate hydrolase family protein n=1 Tax=Moraxella bovoculi TaxID=386891 RepID=UPI000624CF50|nr:fumarylacetoacetate hydrolase family protein [Moraxella bovoculi]AKG19524.1 2-keto-4-pentenoate hydratase [Moraxella bovoculi]NSM11133.1 fumarylacetoacetate hydrolase family protein [Moraxella bovoculi]